MANNSGVRLGATLAADRENLARNADRREATSDAQRKTLQADYLASSSRGQSPGFSTYSRNLDLPPIDPAIVQAMRDEAKRTLTTQPAPFAFDPKDLNGSGWEKAANVGSVIGGVAGSVPTSILRKLGRLIF